MTKIDFMIMDIKFEVNRLLGVGTRAVQCHWANFLK